jgi:hypothetical protein
VNARRESEPSDLERRHVEDHEFRVKSLWENVKEKGLTSSKPEQSKQMIVIDLEEDKCHQIMDFRGLHSGVFMERSFRKF